MSSMRNAIQRRNHRERAQPKEREKWGILEKHKDYSLRAADYQAKKARLRTLRQKAANRNPDEFYFGMMSAKMSKDGFKLGDRGNKALSQDAVRLLKTQDAGYLRLAAQKVKKETEELEGAFLVRGKEVDFCGERGVGRSGAGKMVFVESREEQRAFFGERGKVGQDGRRGEEEDDDELGEYEDQEQRKVIRSFERRKARLEASRARQKQIEAAERELEMQRARMAKHPTVGGVNKWGVKWKIRERKR